MPIIYDVETGRSVTCDKDQLAILLGTEKYTREKPEGIEVSIEETSGSGEELQQLVDSLTVDLKDANDALEVSQAELEASKFETQAAVEKLEEIKENANKQINALKAEVKKLNKK